MANKAIFLDRDDTLIEDPGYIDSPDKVKLIAGIPEALIALAKMDYKLIVVSNQSAVARGIISEKVLDQINDRLSQLLKEKGAHLDAIYCCPYHPEGVVPKYRKQSNQRKPNPGMILKAAEEMDITLAESWMIGDSIRDIQAGITASCETILVDSPSTDRASELGKIKPGYRAINMKEAVNIIKQHLRMLGKSAMPPQSPPEQKKTIPINHAEPDNNPADPANTIMKTDNKKNEQLLESILEQLKRMQRDSMFGEFSITRLMAGVVQVVALFCLLISVWLLTNPNGQKDAIFVSLGFAVVLQLIALTLYIMQERG